MWQYIGWWIFQEAILHQKQFCNFFLEERKISRSFQSPPLVSLFSFFLYLSPLSLHSIFLFLFSLLLFSFDPPPISVNFFPPKFWFSLNSQPNSKSHFFPVSDFYANVWCWRWAWKCRKIIKFEKKLMLGIDLKMQRMITFRKETIDLRVGIHSFLEQKYR